MNDNLLSTSFLAWLTQSYTYLVLAVLFRLGGPQIELFRTDESDVVQVHDFLLPLSRLYSKGMSVTML